MAHANNQRGFSTVVLIVLVLLAAAAGMYFYISSQNKAQPAVTQNENAEIPVKTETPTSPFSNLLTNADTKTVTLDGIEFQVPANWGEPEYIATPFGQALEIKNHSQTQIIRVLSGINQSNTEEELSNFLADLVESGAEMLMLDGNEAAVASSDYQGRTATTIFVTAEGGLSQYSIMIEYPAGDKNGLLELMLSTFEFAD